MTLPEESASAANDPAARQLLEEKLQEVTKDFVTEVAVACDLVHPNLVQLLGHSTTPTLRLVQEMMLGGSLDKALYVDSWRPSPAQVVQVAVDVAEGMNYLHTAFCKGPSGSHGDGQDQAVIHRDLKTPNLLLEAPPPTDGSTDGLRVKITDFGLSRDKNVQANMQTGMMSGCGSVLWMAPEILLGHQYNEKVDVFSYGMCLVELVDHHLPWHGYSGGAANVPYRVTKGERPDKQLATGMDPGMKALIKQCWRKEPGARPTFAGILETLRGMGGGAQQMTRRTSNGARARGIGGAE